MVKFRRRRPLPPPLNPQLPQKPPELMLPYVLADYPRQILLWLANYSELTEKQRELIAELVLFYNAELVGWLIMNNGYAGVVEADAISKQVAAGLFGAVENEYKAKEDDLLNFLEEDLRKKDDR